MRLYCLFIGALLNGLAGLILAAFARMKHFANSDALLPLGGGAHHFKKFVGLCDSGVFLLGLFTQQARVSPNIGISCLSQSDTSFSIANNIQRDVLEEREPRRGWLSGSASFASDASDEITNHESAPIFGNKDRIGLINGLSRKGFDWRRWLQETRVCTEFLRGLLQSGVADCRPVSHKGDLRRPRLDCVKSARLLSILQRLAASAYPAKVLGRTWRAA